jgi:hypothetical protein
MDTMENTWDKFQKQLQEPEFSNECLECVQPVRDCLCEPNLEFTYTLTASFVTERELSEEELGALVLQVAPQIEEPVNAEGDSVDYEIKLITCEVGSLSIKEAK